MYQGALQNQNIQVFLSYEDLERYFQMFIFILKPGYNSVCPSVFPGFNLSPTPVQFESDLI